MSRKGKRKRGIGGFIIALCMFLGLSLGVAGAVGAFYRWSDPVKSLYGKWSATVDITDEPAVQVSNWLKSAAMGSQINVSEYLKDIKVSAILNLREDGTWEILADEGSYKEAKEKAYEGMAQALKALIALRFNSASKQTDPEAIEQLVHNTIGMSLVDYVSQYGPPIMPSFDELRLRFDKSGHYTADREVMVIDDDITAPYMVNSEFLAIDGVSMDGGSILFKRVESSSDTDLAHVFAATKKHRILEDLKIEIDDTYVGTVRTIHYEYRNNRFVSMRDIASLLADTDVGFSVSVASSEINMRTHSPYAKVGGECIGFTTDGEDVPDEGYSTDSLKANKFKVDGNEVMYSTMIGSNPEGKADAFINITDLAMILDVDMYIDGDTLKIHTSSPFTVDEKALSDVGFYHEVRSALVGDATTTEVFVSHSADTAVSIASTTKLMNYLCVMDAVSSGEISLDDMVPVSHKAHVLSMTDDGVIKMEEGEEYSVKDLLYGMLLPSSNECSLLLAEHIAGSEEEYVKLMNDKATILGLSDATIFYNCHGLPVYSDNIFTSKLQNQMSANDMFLLVSYILSVYPQISDITSVKEYSFASSVSIKNMNPMLYNLPDVIGLKTGTTNMAGSSLVSAMKVYDASGDEHIVVAVEYGAEDAITRNTVSEVMLRYGAAMVKNRGGSDTGAERDADIPATAEGLIRLLLAAQGN